MSHPAGTSTTTTGPLHAARLLTFAMGSSLVWIAVALYFVAPAEERWVMPEPWVVAVQLGIGALAYGLVTTVGFRTAPLPVGLAPEHATREAVARFRSGMMLRLAFSEATALVSVALMFLVEETSLVVYLVGAVISLVLLAYAAVPRAATIRRVEADLDRAGARSGLGEALGIAGPPGHSPAK